MEKCSNCKKNIQKSKINKCDICSEIICSFFCLIKHSEIHLKNKNDENERNKLISKLSYKKTTFLTENFNFITSGKFINNSKIDNKIFDFSNYSLIKLIGKGSFGEIYLSKNLLNKQLYAIKILNKKKIKQIFGNLNSIYNEINIHSKLKHKNIIELHYIYENKKEIRMVMDYCKKGNFFSYIKKFPNGMPERLTYKYFIQILNAIYFLHQNNVIHRDIKPENILIDKNNNLKLCDFGYSIELNSELHCTFCGTFEYMAPEIIDKEYYDYSVDIWSLGILLYEMNYGHSPFASNNMRNIMNKIKKHIINFNEKKISEECKDLILNLLNVNPEKRYKLNDILNHPFILKYYENNYENYNDDNDIEELENNKDNLFNKINKYKKREFFIKHKNSDLNIKILNKNDDNMNTISVMNHNILNLNKNLDSNNKENLWNDNLIEYNKTNTNYTDIKINKYEIENKNDIKKKNLFSDFKDDLNDKENYKIENNNEFEIINYRKKKGVFSNPIKNNISKTEKKRIHKDIIKLKNMNGEEPSVFFQFIKKFLEF